MNHHVPTAGTNNAQNIRAVRSQLPNAQRWEGDCGSTVVKVLCYKSVGRWFDPSWCQCIFHRHKILPIALWPWGRLNLSQKWVPGAFPGGKGSRCVRLTTLPPSCAVVTKSGSLNFLEPSGPVQACNGTALPLQRREHWKVKLIGVSFLRRPFIWNTKQLMVWTRHTRHWNTIYKHRLNVIRAYGRTMVKIKMIVTGWRITIQLWVMTASLMNNKF